MSPIVETFSRPEYYGEKKFAEQLEQCLDPHSHIWYNYLPPQGSEIDVILADHKLGFFCIEIKAVRIDAIERYGIDHCVIKGRSSTQNPVRQAIGAMYKLKQRLEDSIGREDMPWLVPTAAFSEIRRADFESKFLKPGKAQIDLLDHLEGIIFADDLTDSEKLKNRLKKINESPAAGNGNLKKVTKDQVSRVVSAIGLAQELGEEPGSQFNVRLGHPRKDSIKEFISPGERGTTIINGLPGSGKTQALLDIAVNHADAGRRVLFSCFNKVLATKFRTDLDHIDLAPETHNRIIIADLFDLNRTLKKDSQLRETFRNFFETVCVDEAQDLEMNSENRLDLITNFVSEDAEWFFACGRDQELYGDKPAQVCKAEEDPENIHELRRPSHTHTNGYRESNLAQVAFDYKFDPSKVDKVGKELLKRMLEDPNFGDETFKHAKKQLKITPVPEGEEVESYKKIIQSELELLKELGAENDLMILTPKKDKRQDNGENEDIRKALRELKVPFHDQVNEDNRRKRLPKDHIRFVTVHSSRGLQATRVILMQPHNFEFTEEKVDNSAAYIALSRSMNGTHIVKNEGRAPSCIQEFIEESNKAYKQAILENIGLL